MTRYCAGRSFNWIDLFHAILLAVYSNRLNFVNGSASQYIFLRLRLPIQKFQPIGRKRTAPFEPDQITPGTTPQRRPPETPRAPTFAPKSNHELELDRQLMEYA
jgi:hypothetical protein